MMRIYRFILPALLVSAFTAIVERRQESKKGLVLYSEDKVHPAHEMTEQGIRVVFRSNKLFDVQLYTEYLDLSRFSGPGHTRAVTDYRGRLAQNRRQHFTQRP
jgi:hypothetical protein